MRISDWSSDVCSSDLGERWRDDAPDPPRIGQSFWRAFRGAEECAGTHRSGDEISRRALWPQNGVRGKSEARLWREGADADDAHGQCCAGPSGMGRRAELSAEIDRKSTRLNSSH